MAWDEDDYSAEWGDDFYEPPDINDILFTDGFDPHAQELMIAGIMEGDDSKYAELVDYIYEVYGLEFEDVFDWQDFREWYDAQ